MYPRSTPHLIGGKVGMAQKSTDPAFDQLNARFGVIEKAAEKLLKDSASFKDAVKGEYGDREWKRRGRGRECEEWEEGASDAARPKREGNLSQPTSALRPFELRCGSGPRRGGLVTCL